MYRVLVWFGLIWFGSVEVSLQINERGNPNSEQSVHTQRDVVCSSWCHDGLRRWYRWVVNVPQYTLAIEYSAFILVYSTSSTGYIGAVCKTCEAESVRSIIRFNVHLRPCHNTAIQPLVSPKNNRRCRGQTIANQATVPVLQRFRLNGVTPPMNFFPTPCNGYRRRCHTVPTTKCYRGTDDNSMLCRRRYDTLTKSRSTIEVAHFRKNIF